MPIKKVPNHLSLIEHEGTVSFFTHSKKGHFEVSEAKLFEAIELNVRAINYDFSVHMSTYPFIAVHVNYGKADVLQNSKDKLRDAIRTALEANLKTI